ncbi:hypothetical protein N9O56_01095 [Rickettsiales bacterium]|nr:hypothetical protein [Rickettsiales bacterium]
MAEKIHDNFIKDLLNKSRAKNFIYSMDSLERFAESQFSSENIEYLRRLAALQDAINKTETVKIKKQAEEMIKLLNEVMNIGSRGKNELDATLKKLLDGEDLELENVKNKSLFALEATKEVQSNMNNIISRYITTPEHEKEAALYKGDPEAVSAKIISQLLKERDGMGFFDRISGRKARVIIKISNIRDSELSPAEKTLEMLGTIQEYPDLPINNQDFSPDIKGQLKAISLCQKIARGRDDISSVDVKQAAELLKNPELNNVVKSIIKEKTGIDSVIFQTGDLEFIKNAISISNISSLGFLGVRAGGSESLIQEAQGILKEQEAAERVAAEKAQQDQRENAATKIQAVARGRATRKKIIAEKERLNKLFNSDEVQQPIDRKSGNDNLFGDVDDFNTAEEVKKIRAKKVIDQATNKMTAIIEKIIKDGDLNIEEVQGQIAEYQKFILDTSSYRSGNEAQFLKDLPRYVDSANFFVRKGSNNLFTKKDIQRGNKDNSSVTLFKKSLQEKVSQESIALIIANLQQRDIESTNVIPTTIALEFGNDINISTAGNSKSILVDIGPDGKSFSISVNQGFSANGLREPNTRLSAEFQRTYIASCDMSSGTPVWSDAQELSNINFSPDISDQNFVAVTKAIGCYDNNLANELTLAKKSLELLGAKISGNPIDQLAKKSLELLGVKISGNPIDQLNKITDDIVEKKDQIDESLYGKDGIVVDGYDDMSAEMIELGELIGDGTLLDVLSKDPAKIEVVKGLRGKIMPVDIKKLQKEAVATKKLQGSLSRNIAAERDMINSTNIADLLQVERNIVVTKEDIAKKNKELKSLQGNLEELQGKDKKRNFIAKLFFPDKDLKNANKELTNINKELENLNQDLENLTKKQNNFKSKLPAEIQDLINKSHLILSDEVVLKIFQEKELEDKGFMQKKRKVDSARHNDFLARSTALQDIAVKERGEAAKAAAEAKVAAAEKAAAEKAAAEKAAARAEAEKINNIASIIANEPGLYEEIKIIREIEALTKKYDNQENNEENLNQKAAKLFEKSGFKQFKNTEVPQTDLITVRDQLLNGRVTMSEKGSKKQPGILDKLRLDEESFLEQILTEKSVDISRATRAIQQLNSQKTASESPKTQNLVKKISSLLQNNVSVNEILEFIAGDTLPDGNANANDIKWLKGAYKENPLNLINAIEKAKEAALKEKALSSLPDGDDVDNLFESDQVTKEESNNLNDSLNILVNKSSQDLMGLMSKIEELRDQNIEDQNTIVQFLEKVNEHTNLVSKTDNIKIDLQRQNATIKNHLGEAVDFNSLNEVQAQVLRGVIPQQGFLGMLNGLSMGRFADFANDHECHPKTESSMNISVQEDGSIRVSQLVNFKFKFNENNTELLSFKTNSELFIDPAGQIINGSTTINPNEVNISPDIELEDITSILAKIDPKISNQENVAKLFSKISESQDLQQKSNMFSRLFSKFFGKDKYTNIENEISSLLTLTFFTENDMVVIQSQIQDLRPFIDFSSGEINNYSSLKNLHNIFKLTNDLQNSNFNEEGRKNLRSELYSLPEDLQGVAKKVVEGIANIPHQVAMFASNDSVKDFITAQSMLQSGILNDVEFNSLNDKIIDSSIREMLIHEGRGAEVHETYQSANISNSTPCSLTNPISAAKLDQRQRGAGSAIVV